MNKNNIFFSMIKFLLCWYKTPKKYIIYILGIKISFKRNNSEK